MIRKYLDAILFVLALGSLAFFFVSRNSALPYTGVPPLLPTSPGGGGLRSPANLAAPAATAVPEGGMGATPQAGATPQSGVSPQGAASPMHPTDPVTDTYQEVDAMLVIDNSGSMFGKYCGDNKPLPGGASDRDGLRLEAANIIITSLAADIEPRGTNLGIVAFGDTVELVSQLTYIGSNDPADAARALLSQKITPPPCLGDTNIVDALKVARDELRSPRHIPGNTPAIIFLTDGFPTKGGNEPEIAQIVGEFQQEGILLFVVLLAKSDNEHIEKFKQFWRGQAAAYPERVREYEPDSAEDLTGIYNDIKMVLDHRTDAPDIEDIPPGPHVEFPLPANVDTAVIKVIKPRPGSSTNLIMYDPSGQDASTTIAPDKFRYFRNDAAAIDVFVIKRPQEGTWVVETDNGSKIKVLKPEMKSIYQIQLVKPDAATPLSIDQTTDIVVQVVDKDDMSRKLDGPFTFEASYRTNGAPKDKDTAVPLTLVDNGNGQYAAQIPAGTFSNLVAYDFLFAAKDDAKLRASPIEYTIEAGFIPSLSSALASKQTVYVDEKFTLSATVVNPESAKDTPLPMASFNPPLPNGQNVVFTSLSSSTFQADIQPLQRPGQYIFGVSYSGKTLTDRDFGSGQAVSITVLERWYTIWLRNLAITLPILIGLYLLYRYILLPFTPLVPLAQKVGIAPQGYVWVQPPDGTPLSRYTIRTRLQQRRKLLRLTVGPGADYDIPLRQKTTTQLLNEGLSQDQIAAKGKRSLWEKLWGQAPAATIGRTFFGATYLQKSNGTKRTFGSGTNHDELMENTIEFSLDDPNTLSP